MVNRFIQCKYCACARSTCPYLRPISTSIQSGRVADKYPKDTSTKGQLKLKKKLKKIRMASVGSANNNKTSVDRDATF